MDPTSSGRRETVTENDLLALDFDHASAGGGGFQILSITPQSSPPLCAGRYYIAVSNCSTTPASLALIPTVTLTPKVATSVSAASFQTGSQASESIVAAFGTNLATQTVVASTLPLPVSLTGTTVLVRDSQGRQRNAFLFFVSPSQVNYQIPQQSLSRQY